MEEVFANCLVEQLKIAGVVAGAILLFFVALLFVHVTPASAVEIGHVTPASAVQIGYPAAVFDCVDLVFVSLAQLSVK